jgi:hypothetical protein
MPISGTRLSSARCGTRCAVTAMAMAALEASRINSPVHGDSNASAMCIEALRRGDKQDRGALLIARA